MKIKEYEAFTLKDGLLQVRQELGPDAVILETQSVRKGGLLGVGARDAVRIVAATGITVSGTESMAESREPSVAASRPGPTHASRLTPHASDVSSLDSRLSALDSEERRRSLQEALREPVAPSPADLPRHAAARYAAAGVATSARPAAHLPDSDAIRRMQAEIGELRSTI